MVTRRRLTICRLLGQEGRVTLTHVMVTRIHFDNLQVRVVKTGRACYTDPCDGYTEMF